METTTELDTTTVGIENTNNLALKSLYNNFYMAINQDGSSAIYNPRLDASINYNSLRFQLVSADGVGIYFYVLETTTMAYVSCKSGTCALLQPGAAPSGDTQASFQFIYLGNGAFYISCLATNSYLRVSHF